MNKDKLVAMLERGADVSVERESLEATMNGMFGGPVDTHRVVVPGLSRYFIDGIPMTAEDVAVAREWHAQRQKR